MTQTTQETTKDEIEQAYALLLAAKKQIEADEKEIETLRKQYAEHLELDADENTEFHAKYNMRVSERNAALRQRDELQSELNALRERNMILEQSNQLVLIQFSNDILTLLSGFDYATPEKGYSSPSLVLSDLNNFINELRRGAVAEYTLRVNAEQTLRQMVNELKAVDMGDSETRIRIYHVLNKYNLL
jgi:vacuolar-type H+-ATPase subunit I/STV1